MASRFWVGGTGTWDNATTTHWSATSGGAGGVSTPTSADDVFLDANSGAGTVTVGAFVTVKNFDSTGFTGTLANSANTIQIVGTTCTIGAAGTYTSPPTLQFNPQAGTTLTVTMNGKTWSAVLVAGAATSTTLLAGALTTGGAFTHNSGIFDTGGFAWQSTTYTAATTTSKTLNLNASTITMTNGAGAWGAGTAGINLTVNPGTSTINANAASAVFNGGGLNYWNLVMNGSGAATISGNNIFNNVTRTGTAVKTDSLTLSGNVTCTGTFTVNGNSVTNRIGVSSSVVGTARTVTAATVSASNVDISDVIAAGGANWDLSAITGLSGDAGGNSGITFTASITQSNNLITPGTSWSNPALWPTRVPLPQDDVNFRGFSTSGQTIVLDMNRLGRNVTFGTGTGGYTIAPNAGAWAIYGNFATGTNTFWSGGVTNGIALRGRGNHTISFAGSGMAGTLDILTPTGTYTLTRAVSMSGAFTLSQGAFNDGGFNVTCSTFASNNANTRALTMSGTWSLISTATITLWNIGSTGTLTFNAAGSTILIGSATASTRTFGGGGLTYGTLTYVVAGSTGALVITGANTFAVINFSDTTNARTLTLPSSTITTVTSAAGWTVNGTAGKLMTVNASTAGTAATLSIAAGTVASDYLSVQDSTATGGATFYAGANSSNVSGNTGWTFTGPVFTGVGNFSGAGTLTTSTTPSISGVAALAGDGTLSTATVPTPVQAASLSGSGTLTTSSVPSPAPLVNFTGDGLLTTTVVPLVSVSAVLTGDGTLTVSTLPSVPGAATLSGTGTLVTSTSPSTSQAVVLSGDGTLVTSSLPSFAAASILTGDGMLTAGAAPSLPSAASFTGNGVLTAVAPVLMQFTGNGTLTAVGRALFDLQVKLLEGYFVTLTGAPDRLVFSTAGDRVVFGQVADRLTLDPVSGPNAP